MCIHCTLCRKNASQATSYCILKLTQNLDNLMLLNWRASVHSYRREERAPVVLDIRCSTLQSYKCRAQLFVLPSPQRHRVITQNKRSNISHQFCKLWGIIIRKNKSNSNQKTPTIWCRSNAPLLPLPERVNNIWPNTRISVCKSSYLCHAERSRLHLKGTKIWFCDSGNGISGH